jgi:pilus assembly protein CpaE
VGTTTLAVNTAAALAKAGVGEVLLIDLHLANGDAALFLGAEPRFSIIDALENVHRIDDSFFRSIVEKTKPGIDLLSSSDRMVQGLSDAKRVRALLEFAVHRYRFIVLDVRDPMSRCSTR